VISFPPEPRPYAETHYRFRALPVSRYYRHMPEIIADLPRRLEPGHDLPILIIVKDAHRFPIKLHEVNIRWRDSNLGSARFPIDMDVDIPYWSQLVTIPAESLPSRELGLDIVIRASQNDREFLVTNHNFPGIPNHHLTVNLSEHPLPKLPGWAVGDLHVHTRYTDDQVEFGAPIDATAHVSRSMGHDFFAATDHSYDLDDTWESYLRNDPDLGKYKAFVEEINRWNRDHTGSFQIIPGEEVSAGNSRKKNVHLLILGAGDLIPGTGDSAEFWFRTKPDLSITEIVERIEPHRVAFAAHPDYQFPLLERLLLHRDTWHQEDFDAPGLTGIQVVRGHSTLPFQAGVTLWIKLLLTGHRLSLATGSDAHGDFNHFSQIKTPMIKLEIARHSLFGDELTLIPASKPISALSLVTEIGKRHTAITTGPGIDFRLPGDQGDYYLPGETCNGGADHAVIQAASSPEFGTISHVMIWAGNPGLQAEELAWIEQSVDANYRLEREISLRLHRDWAYLRAEIRTQGTRSIGRALTTPIFLLM